MRKSDIYRLATLEDGKADADAILRVFAEIASGTLKNDLRFLNYYHEVPVCYPATVQSVEGDSVEFLVHEHQGMVIRHDRYALVKSSHFPKELGVHGFAAYTNVQKKTAILHNFAYAQIRAERREAVRVAVSGRLPVTFTFNGGRVEGLMKDISGTGLSLFASESLALEGDLPGVLSFNLMDNLTLVPARFVRSLKGSEETQVYVFRMEPDRRTETLIGQFSYQRQIEILKDLKEAASQEGGGCLAAG